WVTPRRANRPAMAGRGFREPANPRSPFGRNDGPGNPQDRSFCEGRATRRGTCRVVAEAAPGWTLQPSDRLGLRLAVSEGQTTPLARYALAALRQAGGYRCRYSEGCGLPHVSAHLHDAADAEQRGRKSRSGAATARKQQNYAGPVCPGRDA